MPGKKPDRKSELDRKMCSFRSISLSSLTAALLAMPLGHAAASDLEYAGTINKLAAPVTLRYGAVQDAYTALSVETRVWVNDKSKTTVAKAEYEYDVTLRGTNLHWDIDLTKLTADTKTFGGHAPVINLRKVTDTKGQPKAHAYAFSFPLLKAQGRPEPKPGSALYDLMSKAAKSQGTTLPVLSDKPLREGDLLYTIKAADAFDLPLKAMATTGVTQGRILGTTKFQDRDAVVVKVVGAMAIKGPQIILASDINGYRIIDRETGLLLASVVRIELDGKTHGKKSGITLTKSVLTRLK